MLLPLIVLPLSLSPRGGRGEWRSGFDGALCCLVFMLWLLLKRAVRTVQKTLWKASGDSLLLKDFFDPRLPLAEAYRCIWQRGCILKGITLLGGIAEIASPLNGHQAVHRISVSGNLGAMNFEWSLLEVALCSWGRGVRFGLEGVSLF